MRSASARVVTWVFLLALALAAGAGAACGGSKGAPSPSSATSTGTGGGMPDGGTAAGTGGNPFGHMPMLLALSIVPSSATITSMNGAAAKQLFQLNGKYSDGTIQPITSGATWSADAPPVGMVDAAGDYTAGGSLGGVVHLTAAIDGQKATAVLTVKLAMTQNPAGASPAVVSALAGASTPDATVVWAYPYDGTVWPRGLLPPILQWNGGAATDVYLVHLASPTFDLQQVANASNAPSSQLPVDATTWAGFTGSTAGPATLTVARWDGTAATLVTKQTWTIGEGSMRGTIYYWSNDLGRVLRIQPGAAQPDDFANAAPLNDPAQYAQSSCLMTCHTVSADGSTLISGGGTFGGTYDLSTSMPGYSLGGTWGLSTGSSSSVVRWMMPAVSPDGKYIVTNTMAEGLAFANDGMTMGFLGMYTTADGMPVPTSGLMGVPLGMPTWSPEGSRIVYVNTGSAITGGWAGSWNDPPNGDLDVYQIDVTKNPMVSSPSTLVAAGSDATKSVVWPSITPDGQWVIYGRSAGADTRTGNGDLYFASAVTPNLEVRLASLDGDGYPFAAGSRDLSWNYEPSFAPVAAGGYFWVVFTSRRTYGNILTGDKTVVKQLWVAAIDQNPKPGVDPSHPPFHLTGQDEMNLAMRGFWSLPPCQQDGQSCSSGTDCCGGYCSSPGDGGAPVCGSKPQGCSAAGNKCNATSDCCGAATGVTCINHVCSEPPPP